MMKQMLKTARFAMILAIAPATFACRTMHAAGEDIKDAASTVGDAAEAVFTDQGAEAVIGGSIRDVERRTMTVLRGMGMTIADVDYEDNATEREYHAVMGDRKVHVKLETQSATATKIQASYRQGTLDYDKNQARTIISRVQQQR